MKVRDALTSEREEVELDVGDPPLLTILINPRRGTPKFPGSSESLKGSRLIITAC